MGCLIKIIIQSKCICIRYNKEVTSLVAQIVKNLPAMQETWIQFLGWENTLEEELETLVFLPGESHGQRGLVGYSPWGCKELDTTE